MTRKILIPAAIEQSALESAENNENGMLQRLLYGSRSRTDRALRPQGERGVNGVIDYLRRKRMRRDQQDGRRAS